MNDCGTTNPERRFLMTLDFLFVEGLSVVKMSDLRKRNGNETGEQSRDLSQFIGKERAEKVTNLFAAIYPIFHLLAQGCVTSRE